METKRTLPLAGDSLSVAEPRGVIDSPLNEERLDVALPSHNPLAMLQQLIERGADPESLGKMMDLAERFEAREAKRKWAEAIAGFRNELLPVEKRNAVHTKDGGLMYHFASYADVKTNTSALERKYGIVTSYSFEQGEGDKMVGTLSITVGSHTETTTLPIPITQGQKTNSAQNYGLTVTYCRRYLYCNAFDIIVRDADSDGRIVHDNPEQRPDAPQTGTRNQRGKPTVPGSVLKELAASFWEQFPDIATQPEYAAWVCRITGRNFDALDASQWTTADVPKCKEALRI